MCGIVGIYGTKLLPEDKFISIRDVLQHRGPDNKGIYSSTNCILGHRRLSIIDISEKAAQPMLSEDKNYIITFNGEIYNFLEIKSELISLGYQFTTDSDTEVLLKGFIQWKERILDKLNGFFSFSVYSIIDNVLFIARDRLGIKPLYYHKNKHTLIFASELKSILLSGIVDKKIDNTALNDFINYQYIKEPKSILKDVFKLEAGHYLYGKIVQDEVIIKITPYWDLSSKINYGIHNENYYKNELEELLHSSVKYRMIADVPLGCFLSGGIDSSLISAIAQQESNTKLKTFSIGFDEEFYNEAIYAEKVAAHIGSEHKSLIISEKDCFPIIEKLPFIYDEPFADSSALPTFLVSQLAKKDVTIALSGDGGDELFYGYERYIYISKIYNLIKKVPRSMAPFISTCCKIAPTSKLKRLLYYINLYLSTGAPHQLYNWSISNFNKKELYNLLGDNYSDQDIFNHMAKKFNSKINTVEELFPLLDIKSYLTDDILTKVDRASMANSLEARVPLLDHRIVEFAISTPFALKYHQNTPKHLLRQLLSKHVPNKLIDRPKTGFSIPLNKWLNGNLKYLINQYLEKGLIQQQNIFNYDFIENEKKILASRKYDNSSRVWTILMFQLWYYEWIKN